MLAAITIAVMIAATIAVAALHLGPRMAPGRLVFDLEPDRPHPFGYKMAWLAVRTRDTQHVIATLGLAHVEAANWNTGLGTVYSAEHGERSIFVSPPVNGWTFVAGLALPHPLGSRFADKSTPLLLDLGRQFIEVQYYFSYPAIDYFAWARIIDGRLLRAFAIGDDGVLWSRGKTTKEEKALGLNLFEMRGGRGRKGDVGGNLVLHPTGSHVMRLASKWSIDPTRIDQFPADAALGFVGRAPLAWRAQRLQQAA